MNFNKTVNTVIKVSLLWFISMASYGDVALRVVCLESDQGVTIYINDKKKGSCPNDVITEAGEINLRAVKIVDADHEQVFEESFVMADEDVKKVRVRLSETRLNAAAVKRKVAARLQQEKQDAEAALLKARGGDVDAMNALVTFYEVGLGLPKNIEKSEYWKNKAIQTTQYNNAMRILQQAENGDMHAIDKIIDIYAQGDGLTADSEKAQKWRDKKVEILNAVDKEFALAALKKAQAGDLSAMQTVAGLYKSGKGFEQSSGKAQEWEENYLNALNQQKMLEKKELEIQNKREEIKNIDYFMGFHAMQDIMQESDGILAVFTITLLPTMVLTTVSDLLSAPYKTTKQIMLQNEIDAHAAQWGAPNSMVSKASNEWVNIK